MFATRGGGERFFNQKIKDFVKQGQNDKVKSHIKGLSPSDLIDSTKTSLLHLSARYNNQDLTKHLIKMKCKVNAKDDSKRTPLMVAAMSSSFKTAQILIKANADIYMINDSNKSALQLLLNNKKIPQYLLNVCFEKVKSNNASDKVIAEQLFNAECPLNLVVYLKNSNVTRMIIDHYGEVNPQQADAAMDLALKFEDQGNINVLLRWVVEINIKKPDTRKFLQNICTNKSHNKGNLKLISEILEKVSDWDSLKVHGKYCLGRIFRNASKEVINLFLQHNANDYMKDDSGYDLLINLFGNCHLDAKDLLKGLKFDINSHNEDRHTALHLAVLLNVTSQVQALLESGADPNIPDDYGRTALRFVRLHHNHLIFDSEDEDEDWECNSRQEEMVNYNEMRIIELLLQAGADPQLEINEIYGFRGFEVGSRHKCHMLLAQLAINESMGTPVQEQILQKINDSRKITNVYQRFCQQLEKMKATEVHNSTTLYTILIEDTEKIAEGFYNREAVEKILQIDYADQFHFYYRSKLKNSLKKILHIMDLRAKASKFICESTGLLSSQYIVLEKIISFLTYKDLLVFE